MGLIQANFDLIKVSEDINLRCDPIQVVNLNLSESLKPNEIITNYCLANIVESINNGVNLSANSYSLEPTKKIYISVREFDNGQPLVFNKDGNFKKSIIFLKDEIETNLKDKFEKGKIKSDEIIIARSGAIGKVAWFGEFQNQNPNLILIASGFTTKLKIKKDNDLRFVQIWLNLPFIKYYLMAKSSGKCQRNISQEYLYCIPFPKVESLRQKKLADKFYPLISKLEQAILNLPSNSSIVDLILSEILDVNFKFSKKKGLLYAEDSLINISNRHSLRCDAKQEQKYYQDIINILMTINTNSLGELFSSPFLKGKQPNYLKSPEEEGVAIISTLAIQDCEIVKESCRKVSFDTFTNMTDELKPKHGDILVSLDGAVSVGKPVFFNKEENYGIDSHIGRIRIDSSYDAELIALLMDSELCQAQFKLYESGANSRSINEIELRKILIPSLNNEQIKLFKKMYKEKLKEKEQLASNISVKRNEIYASFIEELKA